MALLNNRVLPRLTFFALETVKWLTALDSETRRKGRLRLRLSLPHLLFLPGQQPSFIAKCISKWFEFVVHSMGPRLSGIGVTTQHWVALSTWATTALMDTAQPLVSGAVTTMLAALTQQGGHALNPWSEPRTSNIGHVILASVADKVCLKVGRSYRVSIPPATRPR
jgi:hypothetical protein